MSSVQNVLFKSEWLGLGLGDGRMMDRYRGNNPGSLSCDLPRLAVITLRHRRCAGLLDLGAECTGEQDSLRIAVAVGVSVVLHLSILPVHRFIW